MGNENTTPKPVTQEQIVSIINASNAKTVEHSEKTASSLELMAYVMLITVIIGVVYAIYRLATKFERMRTEVNLSKAVSLNNVRATVV